MDPLGRSKGAYYLTPSIDELYAQYPRLKGSDHKITSQADDRYNCVAWVERDMGSWIEPDLFWPDGVPEPLGPADLDCYLALFRSWGFEDCDSSSLDFGYLKIAIFATGEEFHHVAKQLPSGAWSSKGGPLYDFKHGDLGAICECGIWRNAMPLHFMRRSYDGSDSFEMEENGLLHP